MMNMINCFTEIMAFTLYFIKKIDVEEPQYNTISEQYTQLIINSRALINEETLSHNDWERALFAVCAWIDEQVLLSNWHDKELWQLNPLQKQYFRTTQAGEKFYEVFERFDPVQDIQVIEVFNYCIKLGFQGKNFNSNQKHQLTINSHLLSDYIEVKGEDLIFAAGYNHNPNNRSRNAGKFGFKTVLVIISAIAVAGLGLLDIIYNILLNEQIIGYFR